MATSGSVSTGKYDGRYYTVSWTATQSVDTNKSTVSWTLKAVGGNSSWYAERTLKVNITSDNTLSGTTSYSKTSRVERYTGTIKTGTFTVTHDSNGDADFKISIQAAVYVSSVNCTGSKTFTLTNIPRKSTLSVETGTLGTAQTLTVTRKSTSFTHTIVATCGDQSKTICTKSTDTSIEFTPPIAWASENTTGTSVSVKYTITTYNGSTSVGSNSYTVTCSIPSSVKPSCSLAVTDPTGYSDTYGGYIKGLSKFKVVVTATKSYESDIASYSTTANGATYTAASFTTDVLASYGDLTVKATVKDKRGRSGSASKTLTVLDYSKPIIESLAVHRCDEDGTENDKGEYAKVTFSAMVTALNNKNSASYKVLYKKSSEDDDAFKEAELDADYTDVYSVAYATCIFEADTGSSYDIKVIATDDFDSIPKTTSVSTGFTLMHWLASGLGMAIGKIAELAGVFDIGFQTKFSGGILQPVLAGGTDLDTIMTPNTYSGNASTTAGYVNSPVTTATSFTLEVMSAGDAGQLLQRITTCTKSKPLIYERFYYSSAWGDWVCISNFGNKVLWSGGMYMTSGHTIALSEAVSKQPHGIVLVFSEYVDGEAKNQAFHRFFVDKATVASHSGVGCVFQLCTSNLAYFATKYLYIHDETITGHDNNSKTITGTCGITATNNRFVLRYVVGV